MRFPDSSYTPLSSANGITRDPSGLLELSDLQSTMLEGWKRPNELYQGNARIYTEEGTGSVFDLAQDVITDCSVVASLCSAIAREERSLGKVLVNLSAPSFNIQVFNGLK